MNKIQSNYKNNFQGFDEHVGHFSETISQNFHRFFLDKRIESPDQYRGLVHTLLSVDEGDLVELMISSEGGCLESAMNIVSAIQESSGTVRAVVTGSCHSSASVIALSCHEVVVLNYVQMLCHTASFGVYGKTPDVVSQVKAEDKFIQKLLKDVYKGFLTPDEIELMIRGKEFWFDAEQIRSRLTKRMQLQKKENYKKKVKKVLDKSLPDSLE